MLRQKIKSFSVFLICCAGVFFSEVARCQTVSSDIFTFNEYVGIVKKHHPRMRQAQIEINKAEAALLVARGAFDPKIEVDFAEKQFKDSQYYSLLNSSFKIPTWYGIEVKAAFDNSEGIYVNPEHKTPDSGLTSLGLTVPVGQGLLINKRMADLRMSKIQVQMSKADQQLQVANTLYDASVAYFKWLKSFEEMALYQEYLDFAIQRYKGITKLIELGDKPAIDSIEAGIVVKNRKLNLEEAKLKLFNAKLELSNYLWLDNVPIELQETLVPESDLVEKIEPDLGLTEIPGNALDEHPLLRSMRGELSILDIERKLSANRLLPKIDLGYHYISEPSTFSNHRFEDYKIGLNFSVPIFLRRERGELSLAKLRIADLQYELDLQKVKLQNQIVSISNQIKALDTQIELTASLVEDYTKMLDAEERLFTFGESSIFIINVRENSLIAGKISQIELENRYLYTNAQLLQILAAIPL